MCVCKSLWKHEEERFFFKIGLLAGLNRPCIKVILYFSNPLQLELSLVGLMAEFLIGKHIILKGSTFPKRFVYILASFSFVNRVVHSGIIGFILVRLQNLHFFSLI